MTNFPTPRETVAMSTSQTMSVIRRIPSTTDKQEIKIPFLKLFQDNKMETKGNVTWLDQYCSLDSRKRRFLILIIIVDEVGYEVGCIVGIRLLISCRDTKLGSNFFSFIQKLFRTDWPTILLSEFLSEIVCRSTATLPPGILHIFYRDSKQKKNTRVEVGLIVLT